MVGLHLAIILLLILLNGVLAMSELAIVSARQGRLQQKADEGSRGAATAIELANNPSKFLSTVQIGITLIGIINGAFGGATLSGPVANLMRRVDFLAPYASSLSGMIVVLLITYLSLIIGELVPKQLALQRAETVATLIAPAMKLLSKLTAPVVWFLSVSNDAVLKLIRADDSDEPAITEDEIRLMLMQATDAGVFERAEQEMVAGVFSLGDRTAGELMTSRQAMSTLDIAEPDSVNLKTMTSTEYSLYPVIDDTPDVVIGVVNTRDLLQQHLMGERLSVRKVMKPALFVPDSQPVLSVLRNMRDHKTAMAIVIDEYGGVDGLLTLDDVLGGLVDELGSTEGEDEVEGITRRDDGTWVAQASVGAHEVRDLFGIKHLEGEDAGRFESIGGYILDQLGHIPVAGESVEAEGFRIEVLQMDGHRIDKVLIIPPDVADEAQDLEPAS